MKWRASLMVLGSVLFGCSVHRGALDPASSQARALDHVFWMFFWPTTLVFVAVILFALAAAVRGARRARVERHPPEGTLPPERERRVERAVAISSTASAVVLVVLLVASIASGHRLSELGAPDPLRVQITAHQWWWEIHYPGAHPSDSVVTSNELHLPAGTPVELELRSGDVVHSFWVPSLNGKRDLIPSHVNKLALLVDRPGTYRGRCAEFCGLEHAKMDIVVVVDTPRAFAEWLDHERAPARTPANASENHGLSVFMRGGCATCHTISGTTAAATVGPDLTHFAERSSIGAGASSQSAERLATWIHDVQGVKPGAHMPPFTLPETDLRALVTYLETLR